MELSSQLGAVLLKAIPQLKVDVHEQISLCVLKYVKTHIYIPKNPSVRGLPVGLDNGKATLLISVVSTVLLQADGCHKRVKLEGVHSQLSAHMKGKRKGSSDKNSVTITWHEASQYPLPNTTLINQYCPQEYLTIIMRRFMMKLPSELH